MGSLVEFIDGQRETRGEKSTARFRQTLRTMRELKHWSQERLADEAGMDHSLVSRLESGQRGPTVANLEKISRALAPGDERARALLYVAAERLPPTPGHYLSALDETVGALFATLTDPDVSRVDQDALRQLVGSAITLARSAAASAGDPARAETIRNLVRDSHQDHEGSYRYLRDAQRSSSTPTD